MGVPIVSIVTGVIPTLIYGIVAIEAFAGVEVIEATLMVVFGSDMVASRNAVEVPSVLGVSVCPHLLGLEDKVDIYPRKLEDSRLRNVSGSRRVAQRGEYIPAALDLQPLETSQAHSAPLAHTQPFRSLECQTTGPRYRERPT